MTTDTFSPDILIIRRKRLFLAINRIAMKNTQNKNQASTPTSKTAHRTLL